MNILAHLVPSLVTISHGLWNSTLHSEALLKATKTSLTLWKITQIQPPKQPTRTKLIQNDQTEPMLYYGRYSTLTFIFHSNWVRYKFQYSRTATMAYVSCKGKEVAFSKLESFSCAIKDQWYVNNVFYVFFWRLVENYDFNDVDNSKILHEAGESNVYGVLESSRCISHLKESLGKSVQFKNRVRAVLSFVLLSVMICQYSLLASSAEKKGTLCSESIFLSIRRMGYVSYLLSAFSVL